MGFVAGTGGSLLLLLFYRVMSNSYLVEPIDGTVPGGAVNTVAYYRRRRRRAA
jgi:hypothetical protein